LFITLSVATVYCYLLKSWDLLAISLGLLTMTRAEGCLFFLAFLVFIPGSKIKLRVVVIYLLSIVPWYVFSWVYLGSFVPDTFFIKTDQGTWMNWDFFNGVDLYSRVYPLETILSLVFVPLLSFLFNRSSRESSILQIIGLTGLVHFAGYTALGVPPFHWYYAPQVTAIISIGSIGLGIAYRHARLLQQKRLLAGITGVYLLTPAIGMFYLLAGGNFLLREAPIHSNWANEAQYKEIGLWLKQEHSGETIRLTVGEIGTLAYYCNCYLLDRFSDRNWLAEYVENQAADPGLLSLLLRINFTFFSAPEFKPDQYVLTAYPGISSKPAEAIKIWDTSSKWIQRGMLILSAK
jgi:hypothetical protein